MRNLQCQARNHDAAKTLSLWTDQHMATTSIIPRTLALLKTSAASLYGLFFLTDVRLYDMEQRQARGRHHRSRLTSTLTSGVVVHPGSTSQIISSAEKQRGMITVVAVTSRGDLRRSNWQTLGKMYAFNLQICCEGKYDERYYRFDLVFWYGNDFPFHLW